MSSKFVTGKERATRIAAFAQHYVRWPPSLASIRVWIGDYPPTPEEPESRRQRKARLRWEKENKVGRSNVQWGIFTSGQSIVIGV